MERFNHLEWPIQKERILDFTRRNRGKLLVDATGVSDLVYDELTRVWANTEGTRFTQQTKTELVQRLIVAIEQRKVT